MADEGRGIPLQHQARIFEPFGLLNSDDPASNYRLDEGSTGLGLSISRELAHVMQGELKLVSREIGSCFRLEVPAETWEVPTEKRVDDDTANQVPKWDGSGTSVLLAEDNNINVMYAVALLKKWNVEVDVASDGLEALKLLKRRQYDVILLDVQMPNLDGLETLRRIRAQDKSAQSDSQRVFMVTAFADSDTRDAATLAGASGFLAKPFSPLELLSVLTTSS